MKMILTSIVVAITLALTPTTGNAAAPAFVSQPPLGISGSISTTASATRLCAQKQLQHPSRNNRRDALTSIATTSFSILLTTLLPLPAHADFALVEARRAGATALTGLKRALKDVQALELAASTNDYAGVLEGLRSPAMKDSRKCCTVLIGAEELAEGPEMENLKRGYEVYVKTLEAVYTQASLGFRGQKKNVALIGYYDAYVKAMKGMIESGERSLAVPTKDTKEAAPVVEALSDLVGSNEKALKEAVPAPAKEALPVVDALSYLVGP